MTTPFADIHSVQPAIAGRETELEALMQSDRPIWLDGTDRDLDTLQACLACARVFLVERAAERSAENEPGWDTLDPKRKRGQREKGNKIQINPKRPAE